MLEFFELNRCNFDQQIEISILFENILNSKKLSESIRYLFISRCKLCKGFGAPHLINFLETNETLVMLSFVMNNSSSKAKNTEVLENEGEP